MTKHVQLSIDGDSLGSHIHVTPIDLSVSDDAAKALEQFIQLADLADLAPGVLHLLTCSGRAAGLHDVSRRSFLPGIAMNAGAGYACVGSEHAGGQQCQNRRLEAQVRRVTMTWVHERFLMVDLHGSH